MPVGLQNPVAATNWLFWWVGVTFFASGLAALIYQITWQRALFSIFGINVEAVTVVVTGFLLGLGLGSLLGGLLSRTRTVELLIIFGLLEITIGAFGMVSLEVFSWAGQQTLQFPNLGVKAVTFALVVVPTVLMGATMPILAQSFVTRSGNVGFSVGTLYCLNTLGAAAACFLSALWLLRSLGMHNSVRFAAAVNVFAGCMGLYLGYRIPGRVNLSVAACRSIPETSETLFRQQRPNLLFAFVIAMLMGYMALSYQLLWFRAFVIGTNQAQAFALILGAYLSGLAIGSCWSRRYFVCSLPSSTLPVILCVVILLFSVLAFLVLPIASRGAAWGGWAGFVLPMLFLVFVQTTSSGIAFPLLCHMGFSASDSAGVHFSWLYVGNILGSVTGAILTGFVLMDQLSTVQISVVLAVLGATAAAMVAAMAPIGWTFRSFVLGIAVAMIVATPFAAPRFYQRFYERIIYKGDFKDIPFVDLLESKHGVIAVDTDKVVFGGGMYDGLVWIDLVDDRNLLVRPVSIALFHPHPREVLMIGLATGAWAQIIVNNPMVEKLTIVEINPDYLKLIAKYPVVRPLLNNPKVEIIIDDGRRWMAKNADRKFDVIIQNTTWHFRPNATNLLSAEYLRLSGSRLRNGGILMYNTTYSSRAQLTGCKLFPYAMRELNMLVASNEPLRLDHSRLRTTLERYAINGRQLFDLSDPRHRARLDEIITWLDPSAPLQRGPKGGMVETCDGIEARTAGLPIITDDNMGEEWDQVTIPYVMAALSELAKRLFN